MFHDRGCFVICNNKEIGFASFQLLFKSWYNLHLCYALSFASLVCKNVGVLLYYYVCANASVFKVFISYWRFLFLSASAVYFISICLLKMSELLFRMIRYFQCSDRCVCCLLLLQPLFTLHILTRDSVFLLLKVFCVFCLTFYLCVRIVPNTYKL